MAQELGGLGEMLELTAFTSLCESVIQHLEATPERVEEIASLALSEWRRSQAAVLGGLGDTIPTQIDLVEDDLVSSNKPNRQSKVGDFIKLIPHLDIHLKCVLNLIENLGSQVAVFQRFCARRLPTYTIEPSLEPKDKSPTAAALPRHKNTILVADDSESVLLLLSLALEKASYQVELAFDGQDALEKLLGGLQVQAVISDLDMPRLGGYSLLDRIKSNPAFKQLPVVIMSARDGEEYRQLAMNLGADAYFTKPGDEQELIKNLSQLVNKQSNDLTK